MRITTLVKKYFFNIIIVVFVLGQYNVAYSQCPTVTNASQTFCDTQSPTIADLQATDNGGGIKWYATAASTTALASGTSLQNGEDYFADDNTGTCGARQSVVVTIYSAPIADPFQGPCVENLNDATLQDFVAIGNNIQWYSTSTGGSPLPITTVIVNGALYYASQTNPFTGCETSRRPVRAVVGYVPTPTGNPVQNFCNVSGTPPTVGDLVASGNNNWYLNSFSSVPLSLSTLLIDGHSYFATTVDPPCESSNRFEVLVNIFEPNDAGSNGALSICENEINTTAPFDLFDILGGTPDNTGVWTGPITTSNGSQGTLDVSSMTLAGSPYVFTYTVSNPACANTVSTITISILPLAIATVSVSPTTICANSSSTITFTGTPNATVTYTLNSGASQTVVLDAIGTATVVTTFNTTTTVDIINVASASSPSCDNNQPSSSVITVIPLPDATAAFAPTTICANDSSTLTFTGTPDATVTYTINSGANQTIVLDGAGTATIVGIYSVDTTVTLVSVTTFGVPSCTKILNQTITLTVIDPIATAAFAPTTICANDSSTLTFTGTPDATVTYTINSGANQTIVLDGTGTATIVGIYSVDTTVTLVSVTTSGVPSCTKLLNQTITLTVIDPIATASFAPVTICANTSSTLTFTGTPDATVTYTINSGVNQTIVLDGTGTATIVGIYSVDTTVTLVSVTTSGVPSCTKILNQTITLTVIDPIATAAFAPTTICANDSSTLTFTGTPDATVTYTINSGANQTIVMDGAGTATIVGIYSVDTTVTLVSVTTSGVPSCTKLLNQTITLTVIDPIATASFAPVTICANTSSTLTFTGTPDATVTYTINNGVNQTIVLDGAGTATIVGIYSVDTTVTLVSVTTSGVPSCTKILNQTVTLTVIDPIATAAFAPTTICANDSSTLTFTGTPDATVTYTINSGANQTIVLDGAGTATIVGIYSVDTTVTLVSVTTSGVPSCTKLLNQTITLTVIDPIATASFAPATICANTISTLTFTGTPDATVTYTINSGANQTIVLDGAGTATIVGIYSVDTTVTLVSVTTSGVPSCTKLLNQTITLTVIDPIATASFAPATICANASSTLTFTGTPDATVTYTINNGANQTIVLDGTGTATIVGIYSVDTTVTLVSVTTSGVPSCTKILNQTITLTVLDPIATAAFAPTTICANDSSTLTFTGTPDATVTYAINSGANQTIVLDATGTATIVGIYSVDTTVTLVSVTTSGVPSCTKLLNQTITLTVIDPIATASFAPATICANDSATLTLTGTPDATVTYTINSGANQTIVLDGTGTATVVGTYSIDTIVALISVTTSGVPSCTKILNQTITLTVIDPTATAAFATTPVCSNTSAVLTFTGTPDATVTYTVNNGANQTIVLDASGTATLTATYTTNTTITLVSVTTSGVPSCTKLLNQIIDLTVNIQPVAGVSPSPVTVCFSSAPFDLFTLLGPTAQLGGTWSPTLTSGTGMFDPTVDLSNTYVYTVTGVAPCTPSSASVQVTVTPVPNAGDDAIFSICSNQDPVDLLPLLGPNAQLGGTWSPSLASGTNILNPAVDAATTYTYTVSGVAPCIDDTASIVVNITPGPEAGASTSITLCVNSATQDLFALLGPNAQPGGTWTNPSNVVVSNILNPATDQAGIYTYTLTGANPCDNDFATVTVTINPIPDAGDNGTKVFCSNDTPTDLFLSLGGTPQLGGTWSPALASGTGVFNPAVDTAQVYTYTVGGTLCTPDFAQVDVTIVQAPNSGGPNQTLNTCIDITSFDLFTGLDGTQEAGTWNDDDASGALTGNIFNPSLAGVGTYHFTYIVIGTSPCLNGNTIVTIVVNPLPNAGTAITMSPVCSFVGTVDLNALLTGQDLGGTWADSNSVVVTSPIDISSFLGGTYSYTYSVTNFCGTDTETVQFDVLPNPIITSANVSAAPICIGSDVTVTLTGIVDGNYALNYDLSGSNVATGQSVTVVVSGGTASFTILAATVPNTGNTTINFTNIQNTVTTCQATLTNVSTTFIINPTVQIDNSNITVADLCLGSVATVTISNALNLPDGDYQFNYTIPTGNPTTGNSGNVTITGGNGSFTIPASVFGVTGNYSITINSIITATGCSNNNEDATTSFNVVTTPNAGTAITMSPVCPYVGTVDLNALLTGQDLGGTWTDSNSQVVTSPIDISSFLGGTYSYTYSVTNFCGTDTETVQFDVLPNPIITSANVSAAPICIGSDVTVTLTGIVDGNYSLNYDLSGSNVATGQSVTVVVSGGTASFTILAATVPNTGNTTINFTNIQNTVTSCQSILTDVNATIIINPIVQMDNNNIAVAQVCLGSVATVTISNAINLPDGVYQFNYTIPTGNPTIGNSGNVTITGGNGSFPIPASVFGVIGNYSITINSIITATGCSNNNEDATANFTVVTTPNSGTAGTTNSYCTSVGVVDLTTLLTGEDTGGTWTDSSSQVVASVINVLSFTSGTYTYNYTVTNACGTSITPVQFTILQSPILTSLNVTAASICIGNNGIVNFNGMADGTYTINYDLGGVNPLAGQQATVTILGGVGNFTIPSASIPNAGVTIISFTNISNSTTSCFSLLNFATSLLIKPVADIDSANLSIATVCFGNAVVVNITNATGLLDGLYQFNYSIPGANPTGGNSGDVTIIGGVGQFTLPANLFTISGNYTMTIIGIVASAGGCTNPNENATANFTINPIPDFNGATVSVLTTCPNFDSTATISGALNLNDGIYSIDYNLSGANTTGTISTTLTITSGGGTIVIPAANLTSAGVTTISITSITSATTGCGGVSATPLSTTFDVTALSPPTLILDGNIFCDDDNPTVANLTANIVGGQTVIWYNAPSGGTAFAESELLVNGTTYYAAAVAASGCESATRLEVIADLTDCPDIKIPDGFSPNDDGVNDTFVINNLPELYPKFTLEIYNRYGNKVYEGNINTPNWNGTTTEGGLKLGSNLLPTGVYFFIIHFNDGVRKAYQDRVYLSR